METKLPEVKSAPPRHEVILNDALSLDYQNTLERIKQYTDIRFKLLALLPIATGAALNTIDPGKNPMHGLALGLMGFFSTLGILTYDQRNNELYEHSSKKMGALESSLGFPAARCARGRLLFRRMLMWHDRGLAFIYCSVLAAWSYLISASIIEPAIQTAWMAAIGRVAEFIVPIIVARLFWKELHRLDDAKGRAEDAGKLESDAMPH